MKIGPPFDLVRVFWSARLLVFKMNTLVFSIMFIIECAVINKIKRWNPTNMGPCCPIPLPMCMWHITLPEWWGIVWWKPLPPPPPCVVLGRRFFYYTCVFKVFALCSSSSTHPSNIGVQIKNKQTTPAYLSGVSSYASIQGVVVVLPCK